MTTHPTPGVVGEVAEALDVADGLYPDVPDADYRAWPRLSKSRLEFGTVSMAHLKAAVDGLLTKSDTDAMAFGRAIHCKLLLPEVYRDQYAVAGQCQESTAKQERCTRGGSIRVGGGWVCSQHAKGMVADPVEVLSRDEAESIDAISASVKAHPVVKLFRQAGGCEMSMAWTDPGTGIKLKGRADKIVTGGGFPPTIIDAKTAIDLTHEALSRTIYNYGYHRQAAIYLSGYKAITGKDGDFVFVFVEKSPPFAVAVYRLGQASLQLGRVEVASVLQRWKWACENDTYEGFGDDIGEIDVPAWELKKQEIAA